MIVEKNDQKIIKTFGIKNGEELSRIYMKTDIIFLADVSENLKEVSTRECGVTPLYCVCIRIYTLKCGLIYTDIKIQILQDNDTTLLLENNIRGGISSVTGDRYGKWDENKKIIYMDATN